MATNEKPVMNRFNPLFLGDAEEIAARIVRSMSEPALSFEGGLWRAPAATSEQNASEQAVTQEQI